MRKRNHIVDLSSRSSLSNSLTEYRPLPVLIKNIQTLSITALETKLVDMLNTADDRLFDMAETSYNNAQFDAMRLLRVKREGLISRFKQELANNFKQAIGKIEPAYESSENIETLSFENIALVKDDDLEEDIATDAMINKARTKNQDALEHIRVRMDTIVADRSIDSETNPLEPVYICEAFRAATEALDLDIASLLIIYKLFDRSVIGQLDDVYLLVNQFFVEKGILPELKIGTYVVKNPSVDVSVGNLSSGINIDSPLNNEVINSPSTQGTNPPTMAKSQPNITQSNHSVIDQSNVVSILQQLLAENRADLALPSTQNSGHQSQPLSNDVSASGIGTSTSQEIVATDQLVQALSHIQIQQMRSGLTNRSNQGSLRQSIAVQLSDSPNTGMLGQFNEDMIDIVSMLFDFILEDENLALEIKSIIARLQIPMLKVGLVDKNFFSQRRHPARRLLNELAHAGLAWDKNDATAKPMLHKITEVAERVFEDFEEDISLFDELLEDFIGFKTQHQQRSKIFERRTKEAEEGKAKTESARGDVNRRLKSICKDQHLPDIVKKLLKSVLSHAMLLEKLKENKDGWQNKSKLAKLLVWSVQPIDAQERLDKMKNKIPVLVKGLREGFELVALSPIETTNLFEQLERCHRNIIESAKETIKKAKEDDLIRLPAIDVDSVNVDIQTGDLQSTAAQLEQQSSPIVKDNQRHPVNEEIIIEDVGFTKAEVGQSPSKMIGEPVKITQEVEQTIEQLRAGSWVELKIDDRFQRSKLAARIATSGKYIFVNRNGMKMAEFLTNELCQYLQLGNMKILDDDALFDRALESVISNLRSMKAEA